MTINFYSSILLLNALIIANCTFSSAKSCDSATIYKIIHKQVKIADKSFTKNYFLCKESVLKDTSSNFEHDSIFFLDICSEIKLWDSKLIESGIANILPRDSLKYMDYFCFISKPFFTKRMNRCKLNMSTHSSEWGGCTRIYTYRKIFGIWFLMKTYTKSVS